MKTFSLWILCGTLLAASPAPPAPAEYRVLATSRTSTMQKEMNEAAAEGFRLADFMGGETGFGGSEVVVIMTRAREGKARFEYRLLATSRTSTMQKELQAAGDAGYEYKGQSVFKSAFGGKEVVVILERDTRATAPVRYDYQLLATSRTSTMQKELADAARDGYEFVGLTIGQTTLGGTEIVTIVRRRAR